MGIWSWWTRRGDTTDDFDGDGNGDIDGGERDDNEANEGGSDTAHDGEVKNKDDAEGHNGSHDEPRRQRRRRHDNEPYLACVFHGAKSFPSFFLN